MPHESLRPSFKVVVAAICFLFAVVLAWNAVEDRHRWHIWVMTAKFLAALGLFVLGVRQLARARRPSPARVKRPNQPPENNARDLT